MHHHRRDLTTTVRVGGLLAALILGATACSDDSSSDAGSKVVVATGTFAGDDAAFQLGGFVEGLGYEIAGAGDYAGDLVGRGTYNGHAQPGEANASTWETTGGFDGTLEGVGDGSFEMTAQGVNDADGSQSSTATIVGVSGAFEGATGTMTTTGSGGSEGANSLEYRAEFVWPAD